MKVEMNPITKNIMVPMSFIDEEYSFDDEYIIKKDDGVVIKLYDEDDFYCSDFEVVLDSMVSDKTAQGIIYTCTITSDFPKYPPIIRGVARLAINDTWDEELGKKIADAKVAFKRHKRVIQKAKAIKKMLTKAIAELDKIIAKYTKKCDAIQDDYERYFIRRDVR